MFLSRRSLRQPKQQHRLAFLKRRKPQKLRLFPLSPLSLRVASSCRRQDHGLLTARRRRFPERQGIPDRLEASLVECSAADRFSSALGQVCPDQAVPVARAAPVHGLEWLAPADAVPCIRRDPRLPAVRARAPALVGQDLVPEHLEDVRASPLAVPAHVPVLAARDRVDQVAHREWCRRRVIRREDHLRGPASAVVDSATKRAKKAR